MRITLILCAGMMALAGCDAAEFDPDPEVRADARGSRKCVVAVRNQTGDSSAVLNTTLPIVEINQFIVDVPGNQSQWLCQTDDNGNAQELLQINAPAAT